MKIVKSTGSFSDNIEKLKKALADAGAVVIGAGAGLSTGVFMFSNQRAAEIAVQAVRDWLQEHDGIWKVVFNVFKDIDLEIYDKLLNQ